MTDMKICVAAMTEWPEGARPKGIVLLRSFTDKQVSFLPHEYADEALMNDHAIALFEIAGLKWLSDFYPGRRYVQIDRDDHNGTFEVSISHIDRAIEHSGSGPTLLSALHSAILSTSK